MNVEDLALGAGRLRPEQIRSLGWRALSFIASSIYFSNLPIILFLVYMHTNSFFSYDFYERGLFGMKAFFGLLVLMFLVTAFALYAFLFPLMKWVLKKNLEIGNLVGLSFLSGLMWLFFSLVAYFSEWLDWQRLFYVGAVCLLIAIHIGVMLYTTPKSQFISLAVVIFITLILTFHLREAASSLVGTALHNFGSGGRACVTVTDTEKRYRLTGLLILTSPEYVYLQQRDQSSVTAVKVDSKTLYSVGRGECDNPKDKIGERPRH